MPTNLSATSFTAGSGNIGISTFYFLWVPARELFSPETGLCDTNGANNIYIFLGNDQTNPDATCEVDLAEQAIPPTPPISPSAESGDSAITVSWHGPALTNLNDMNSANGLISPSYYQVLCADQSGNPIKSNPQPPAYSTCQADGIHRRQNIFAPTNIRAAVVTAAWSMPALSRISSASPATYLRPARRPRSPTAASTAAPISALRPTWPPTRSTPRRG